MIVYIHLRELIGLSVRRRKYKGGVGGRSKDQINKERVMREIRKIPN